MTSAGVLLEYQQRVALLQDSLNEVRGKQGLSLALLALALLSAISLAVLASSNALPGWSVLIPLCFTPFAIRKYLHEGLDARRFSRLHHFTEQGIARLSEHWSGNGCSGLEFAEPGHLYASDLNLFGEASLFDRLCTARTHIGRERLASFLQHPVSADEIRQRQAAVRELAPRTDLRDRIAVLGKFDFEESHRKTFSALIESPPANFAQWLRPYTLISSAALAVLCLAHLSMPAARPFVLTPIVLLATAQTATTLSLRQRVKPILNAATPIAVEIDLIREGLGVMAAQRFATPKLKALVLCAGPAPEAIGELRPWFAILRRRNEEWWAALSTLLMLGTQSALALDAWQRTHGTELRAWLDAWAEFEALNSLACYAHENPEDAWPEVTDVAGAPAYFDATGLGHPLLPRSKCVTNPVSLHANGDGRFLVVSGSNMAGKSTMLRSIGLSVVLTFAGAPVRARSVRLSLLRVCASITVVDSLKEGKSKFLAEVQRLQSMLQTAANHPTLFLIDEIFSGTNSPDRQAAADAVIRTLAARGAIGAVSTHDVALASIAVHGGTNVHMASRKDSSNPLDFDFLLKPGVTTESNALAIARLAGVPV